MDGAWGFAASPVVTPAETAPRPTTSRRIRACSGALRKAPPSNNSSCKIYGNLDATAVDRENGISRSRSYEPTQASAGWEYVPEMNLEENAARIREEVVEHLSAPAVKPGKKDLLLLPSHLCPTIHESVAHPTELDRALGYEAKIPRQRKPLRLGLSYKAGFHLGRQFDGHCHNLRLLSQIPD